MVVLRKEWTSSRRLETASSTKNDINMRLASFPPQIQGLRQIQYFQNKTKKNKDSELPCLGQQD